MSKSTEKKKVRHVLSSSDEEDDEKTKKKSTTGHMLWIDRYKPRKIDDLLVDDLVRTLLTKIIETKEMPNLILTGMPGVGKTSALMCLLEQLLGNNFNKMTLILSTFHDRGIGVKQKMETFCKKELCVFDEDGKQIENPHKIIILNEVDIMNDKAHQAVCELMEKYKNKVRFAFTCNDSEKIISIQKTSCNIIRFTSISRDKMLHRLKEICKLEKVKFTIEALEIIERLSGGDIREAINNLELVAKSNDIVNEDAVLEICNIPRPEDIRALIKSCYKKDFDKAHSMYEELKQKGHSNIDILNSIYDQIQYSEEYSDEYKIRFLGITSDTILFINKGTNTKLQMSTYISRLVTKINIS